jgi:hypothetical protein
MKRSTTLTVVSTSTLVLGAAHQATAQTTIQTIDTTIGTGQVYDLNLNGETANPVNFAIRFDGAKSTPSTWTDVNQPFVSARTQDTGNTSQDTYVFGTLDPNQSPNVVGLPLLGAGATIGASSGYTAGTLGYLYQDYNNFTVGGWSQTTPSDGYVGLEFTSAGGSVINYGWVEIAYNYNGGTGSTIDIERAAYDANPNESLVTPPTVPEPATAAMIGVGTLALAGLGRLKRK